MIQSPLNYTGGKFKLLPQILPLFPKDIDVFVDLFCGGCNVGINVDCNRVIYNDLNENLLYLYNTFKNLDKESVLEWIYEIIEKGQNSKVRWNFMFPWLKLTTIPKINALTRTPITLLRGLRLTSFI